MKTENMKNIVVLRNLPSNMVEEALIILKPNLKIKEIDRIKRNSNEGIMNKTVNAKEYIVKEAELLVSNYISDLEKKNQIQNEKKMKKKYQHLKRTSVILAMFLSISLFIQFFIK